MPIQLLRLAPRKIGNKPIDAPTNRMTIPMVPEKARTRRRIKMMLIFIMP